MVNQLKISESSFQSTCIQLLQLTGWKVCHFRPALTAKGWRTPIQGDKGFPDIIAVKGERLLVIELKSSTGTLSPEQKEWQVALSKVTRAEYYTFKPINYPELEGIVKEQ